MPGVKKENLLKITNPEEYGRRKERALANRRLLHQHNYQRQKEIVNELKKADPEEYKRRMLKARNSRKRYAARMRDDTSQKGIPWRERRKFHSKKHYNNLVNKQKILERSKIRRDLLRNDPVELAKNRLKARAYVREIKEENGERYERYLMLRCVASKKHRQKKEEQEVAEALLQLHQQFF